MRDRFGAKNERSMMLRFHTQTAGSTLTAQQPDNNVVRTTIEALAAVLGGTQSLHTNAKDERSPCPRKNPHCSPCAPSKSLPTNPGVTRRTDPLGGSPYIESLTDQLAQQAREYLNKIGQHGRDAQGHRKRLRVQGDLSRRVRTPESRRAQEKIIVGVNECVSDKKLKIQMQKIDPQLEPRRRRDPSRPAQETHAAKVSKCLATLKKQPRARRT